MNQQFNLAAANLSNETSQIDSPAAIELHQGACIHSPRDAAILGASSFIDKIEREIQSELQRVQRRQDRIDLLHKFIKAINKATDSYSNLDLNKHPELQKMCAELQEAVKKMKVEAQQLETKAEGKLEEARKLESVGKVDEAKALREEAQKMKEEAKEIQETAEALTLDPAKKYYYKDERDRLIDSLRTTCDSLNVHNEMQMQSIHHKEDMRLEAYNLVRSVHKTSHDTYMSVARAIAGK